MPVHSQLVLCKRIRFFTTCFELLATDWFCSVAQPRPRKPPQIKTEALMKKFGVALSGGLCLFLYLSRMN